MQGRSSHQSHGRTEKEERDAKRNSNRVNMDTISPCLHSAISPSQGDIARVTSEKRISSINGFSELMIQSTINNSDDDDAESDPNSNPKISNYTIKGNSQQKLFNNRFIPNIIPGAICLIAHLITEDVPGFR